MTPEERLLLREFLISLQGIPSLKDYIHGFSESGDPKSYQLARVLSPGYYLEVANENEIKAFKENVSAELHLKSNGNTVEDLFNYIDITFAIPFRSDVKEFIKNNYEKITPELIFQEEKVLQNEYIDELHLKTGMSKKQALMYTKLTTEGNNRESTEYAIYNEIASALLLHPEIQKLNLKEVDALDKHAKQVVTNVMEDIRNGKDTSGVFVPYSEKIDAEGMADFFNAGAVETTIYRWYHGEEQPVEIKRVTREDIDKELLEGVNVKQSETHQDVIVQNSEEYLKERDQKREELEREEPKLAEKRAMNLTLNHKSIPEEVAFSADEDDIAFYNECLDPEIVPGLKDKLFSAKISRMDVSDYYKFEQEVFNMIESSASDNRMAYGGYDLNMVRHLIRYVAAKQDDMVSFGYEYLADDVKINESKTKNKKYLDELDNIVKQNELFKSYLADPVPTYEQTDGSYLKTYEKNKAQYINKLNNSFDNLSADKKYELYLEAKKITNEHPYISSTDVMKYFIRQQSESLGLYHECVDPDDMDKSLGERYIAPFTFELIGRGLGARGRTYEKAQEELKKQKEPQIIEQPQIIEEQKQEIKEEPQIIEQPQIIEEQKQEIKEESKPVMPVEQNTLDDLQSKLLETKGADTYVQFADTIRTSLEQGLVVAVGDDVAVRVAKSLKKDEQGQYVLVCSNNEGKEVEYSLSDLFYNPNSEFTSVLIRNHNASSPELKDRKINVEQLRNAKREEIINEIMQSDKVQQFVFGSSSDQQKRKDILSKPANQMQNNKDNKIFVRMFNNAFDKVCKDELNGKYGIDCLKTLQIDKSEIYDRLADLQMKEINALVSQQKQEIKEEPQIIEESKQEIKEEIPKDVMKEVPQEEPKPVVKQDVKPIKNIGDQLKKLGKKLEDAKTFVNSSEYKDIIKMLKVFDENAKIPHTKDLNANQLQAVQLFAIKDRVDAYITHKAKDGVKQNVYKKLAAVEELNKFLCKTIKELSPNKFSVGAKNQFDPSELHENFLDGIENDNLKDRLDFEKQNGTFQEKFDAIKGKFNTSIGEYKNVQDCMGRIICSAVNNGIDTKVLFTQKETFMTKPSTTGQPEKQQQKEGNAVGM